MKNVDWNVYIEEEWEIIKVYVIFFFKFNEDVHIYYKIQEVLGKGINFVYFRVKFCKNCGWKMLIEMYVYIEEEWEIIKVYVIFFFKFDEDVHIYIL